MIFHSEDKRFIWQKIKEKVSKENMRKKMGEILEFNMELNEIKKFADRGNSLSADFFMFYYTGRLLMMGALFGFV